jgi:hypothetical protein
MVDARGFLHPALGFAALSEPTAQHPALAATGGQLAGVGVVADRSTIG